MSNPIVICCGFFESRHKTLAHELSQYFNIHLFLCDGDWAEYLKLPLDNIEIEPAKVENAVHTYERFITQIEKRFQLKGNPGAKKTVIEYVTKLYKDTEVVRENIKTFLEKKNVAAILAVNDHLGPIRTLVNLGKENSIPTIYIEHGFSFTAFTASASRFKDKPELPVSNIICVDNELQKKEYLDFYEKKQNKPEIVVTGNPLDGVVSNKHVKNKTQLKDCTKSCILFCPSWFEANSLREVLMGNEVENEAFRHFCEMIKGLNIKSPNKKFQAVVKLHPTMTKVLGVNTASYYERIADEYGILSNLIVDDGPIKNWLNKTILLVTSRNSSVSWEAFLCHIPVITYFSEFYKNIIKPEKWQHPTYLSQWGIQFYLDEKADWVLTAEKLIMKHQNGEITNLCVQQQNKFTQISTEEASKNVIKLIQKRADSMKIETINKKRPPKNKSLRVLQIVHDFPPNSYSGTELYTFNFSCELKELGHNVTVLFPVHEKKKPFCNFEELEYKGLRVVKFNVYQPDRKNTDILNFEFDAPFKLFLQKHKFDIVHIQHLYGMSSNWVDIVKELELPIVMKLDDMYLYCRQGHLMFENKTHCSGPESIDKCFDCIFRENSKNDPEYIGSIYYYLAMRREVLKRMFSKVDFIYTPSKFLKEAYLENNLKNDNFHVIPTGISPFSVGMHKKEEKSIRIGFMGEIDIRKGINIFCEAIERANNSLTVEQQKQLKFKIFGRNFGNKFYHDMLASIERNKNITYMGSFTPEQRAAIFSEIDVLVAPSIGENYPFIIREALFAGLPVIATHIAGVPEIVQDKKNGLLLTPGDVKGLAQIFIKLCNAPHYLKKLNPSVNKARLISEDALELEQVYFQLLKEQLGIETGSIPDLDDVRELIAKNAYVDGINLLARIIDDDPQNPEAMNLMAEVYKKLGKTEEAIRLKEIASKIPY